LCPNQLGPSVFKRAQFIQALSVCLDILITPLDEFQQSHFFMSSILKGGIRKAQPSLFPPQFLRR